jgi:hypothetical protein
MYVAQPYFHANAAQQHIRDGRTASGAPLNVNVTQRHTRSH